MTRRSVDLPEPLGPSSAISAPLGTLDRHVVERDELAEALRHVAGRDHVRSSRGRNIVISSKVAIAIIASSTDAA